MASFQRRKGELTQNQETPLWRAGTGKGYAQIGGKDNKKQDVSQIIPYQDSDLERLYVFLRHLAANLPRRKSSPAYQVDDEVQLEYYRLQKISEGSISLQGGDARRLDGPTDVGSGLVRSRPVPHLQSFIQITHPKRRIGDEQQNLLLLIYSTERKAIWDNRRQTTISPYRDSTHATFLPFLWQSLRSREERIQAVSPCHQHRQAWP
jgi:hypothetical protein